MNIDFYRFRFESFDDVREILSIVMILLVIVFVVSEYSLIDL